MCNNYIHNDSDNDVDDLVGEDVDIEVERDDNIEISND